MLSAGVPICSAIVTADGGFNFLADYFKHDPIAFRHCILYEFVQGKPVDIAYTEFCEKFPAYPLNPCKVIEKEEFEYWFDQFKQGKFDEDKEPVADMKGILRNDKRALRACILYEKCPNNVYKIEHHGGIILPYIRDDYDENFKEYLHFRDVLGKDAMDYKEFRFWMKRFSRKEFDLGYKGTMDFKATDVDFNKFERYLEMLDRLSDMFKDPIILRYCLLFEFLKHMPIEIVFKTFCRKVGEKVIDLDTFKYWFSQFDQGIFGDNRGPVADMRDILRNDPRALRICILYVSLNFKIFDRWPGRGVKNMEDRRFPVYSLFCDIIGEDVMKYEEFVYWQIRFSDGKFDLDHERNLENKKDLDLIDMPHLVMKNVVQYLNIVDKTQVRRTSKAFLAFIDSQPLFLQKISFCLENSHGTDSWRIEIRSNPKKIYSTIYTDNQQNQYTIERHFQSRLIDREDYEKCAIEDAKAIFKTPNLHVEHLAIEADDFGLIDYMNFIDEVPTQNDLLDELASVIDPSIKPHIKSIHIKSIVLEPIVNFLSYLEPGYLESISLDFKYTHGTGFSKMLELEQFKQAKEFNIFRCLLPVLFVVFKSSTFNFCTLSVNGQFDFDGIRRELDSLVPGTREDTFRHLIPNTEDCFEISINTSGIYVFKKKDYREEDRRQMEMNNRFRRIQM